MKTCTVMSQTDGTTSFYVVLRGKMRGRAFDAHSAETLATYKRTGKVTDADYRAMTAAHATPKAPAVYWQAP